MKPDKFFLIGTLCLSFWLLDFILKIYYHGFPNYEFFWLCSILLLFLSIGYFKKNSLIFNTVFSGTLIIQIFWILDYISIIFFNIPLNGHASYINGLRGLEFVNTLRHLFMLPLAFYGWISLWKPAKRAWLLNISIAVPIGIISYLSKENINCIKEACLLGNSFKIGIASFFIAVILSVLISHGLNRLVKLKKPEWVDDIFYWYILIALVLSAAGILKIIILPKIFGFIFYLI